MRGERIKTFLRSYAIFLVIPMIILGCSFWLKAASGPYWLAPNFDPSYQYLVNGLYLIKGYVPNHSDHPGTPLQMLCCAAYWLFNCGRPAGEIVRQVLMNPEFYLHFIFGALSLFSFLTSIGLAVFVFRRTNDALAALLSQLPALSFLTMKSWETLEPVFPVVANVDPEGMLIGAVNLFNICLLLSFFARTTREQYAASLLWGSVCGLGAAVKLTVLPLLAVPLMVLSWDKKLIFMAAFAASFVLWTLPILSRYHIIGGWISTIAMHKGVGGIGNLSGYFLNWKNIFIQQWAFGVCLLVSMVLMIWKVGVKGWDRGTFFLAATTGGAVLQFFAVTQHSGAHYLLPGIGLFSPIFVLFYLQCPLKHTLSKTMAIIFIWTAVLSGVWQAAVYHAKLEAMTRQVIRFHDADQEKYQNCTFIDYYRSSDPRAALFFGDGWNLSPRLGGELFGLYPQQYYFQVWQQRILNFKGTVWANELLAQNPCVLFRGDGNFDFSQGPYRLKLLEKGPFESIHLLTGTTEEQSAVLLAAAVQFYQKGARDKALECSLQARKLHYQPDATVESLIQLFASTPGNQH